MALKRVIKPITLNKENLSRFKIPEFQEREEGYDGHFEWDSSDVVKIMLYEFRLSVLRGDTDSILHTFDSMGVAAAEHQLTHVANLLVDRSSAEPLKEAMLTAICIGSRPMVEIIIVLFHEFPHEEFSGCTDSLAFLPHITPIVLAGLMNNFGIMECLLLRGHKIDIPHHKHCACPACRTITHSNMDSVRRIDIFRALSSEAYLWLATEDPFMAACELATDLEQCMADDNLEFMESYRQLHDNVQLFALRICEQCWKVDEIDVFLSQRDGEFLLDCEQPYPRLRKALDCSMKQFAASANIQRACESMWTRGWGHFGSNTKRDLWRMIRHFLFYPIFAMIFIVTGGRKCTSFNVPLARYISNLSSYLGFLTVIVVVRYVKLQTAKYDRQGSLEFPLQLALTFYIYSYILGLTLDRFLEFTRRGFSVYFSLWWRSIDLLLITAFQLAAFTFIIQLQGGDSLGGKLNRRNWPSLDVNLLNDVFFGIGCILAFWKLFYYFQLIKGLGATVISISRCVVQVVNYMIVMGTIMASFAIGINTMAQPYMGNEAKQPDGMVKVQDQLHTGFLTSFRNLFWSFYGYLSPQGYAVVVGNSGPGQWTTDHIITSFAIETTLGVYHAILIVTILNLMISMLVRKSDEVLDNEENEFKFIRACIYTEFMESSTSVPPPFNLLHIVVQFIDKAFRKDYTWTFPELFVKRENVEPLAEESEVHKKAYLNLLRILFRRYINTKTYHFKTVYRSESTKLKQTGAAAKVAFMNAHVQEESPPLFI